MNDIYNMIEESPNRLILDTATAADKDVDKTPFYNMTRGEVKENMG